MSSTPDEITIEYEESGQILIKELDKVILSKGAWTTILFRYQELDAETGEYGPDKYAIRRYQKSGAENRQTTKFNITSPNRLARSWMPSPAGSRTLDAHPCPNAFRRPRDGFFLFSDGHRPCGRLVFSHRDAVYGRRHACA